MVAPYFLHHRGDIWDNLHKFNPDRFLEDEILKRPKNSFLLFSIGPRSCIGEFFSRMEMKLFLVMFARRFKFSLDTKIPVVPFASITLRPKNGIYIFVSGRKYEK